MKHPFAEEQYISLSALQHYTFCPRQCAIIHTEQEWSENILTTFGELEHERVHTAPSSVRDGVRTARGIPLVNHRWGIRGFADAVEYRQEQDQLSITPVEYKHGKPDQTPADSIQLCAQTLCLEEMNQCQIPAGYLYYQSIRRRVKVDMDEALRQRTIQTIEATRQLLESGILPAATKQEHCEACSLVDICLPTSRKQTVAQYNQQQIAACLEASLEE